VNEKEILMESVDILINERLKNLSFNRYIEAKVTVDHENDTYDVLYNNQTITNVKVRAGLSLTVGDIVYIMIPNNQFSNLFIDLQVP
jgi:hypothetical protein